MKLSFKAKRNIGLIVLTVAVIVAIILTIVLVQKYGDDEKPVKGAIGQTVSTSQADVCVNSMRVSQFVGEVEAKDGKCFLLVKVDVKANKKLKVSSCDFVVEGANNVTDGYSGKNGHAFYAELVEYSLKKGESVDYSLIFEVEKDRIESYFLYAFGAKIDLGGTVKPIVERTKCPPIYAVVTDL
ncbi:MAG: DUF4352 domain-containing protein [Clostridiales bacterium]|nr:DUF4352 domain-containing protein [Clostridiales bacterium]